MRKRYSPTLILLCLVPPAAFFLAFPVYSGHGPLWSRLLLPVGTTAVATVSFFVGWLIVQQKHKLTLPITLDIPLPPDANVKK